MMLPDRVFAASDGGNTGVSIGGYDDDLKPFIFVDFACGSWGGRPWADGVQGNSNMFANMACQSIEVIEAENPLQVRSYEFLPDRAGPWIRKPCYKCVRTDARFHRTVCMADNPEDPQTIR